MSVTTEVMSHGRSGVEKHILAANPKWKHMVSEDLFYSIPSVPRVFNTTAKVTSFSMFHGQFDRRGAALQNFPDQRISGICGKDIEFISPERVPIEFAPRTGMRGDQNPASTGDGLVKPLTEPNCLQPRFVLECSRAVRDAAKIIPLHSVHSTREVDIFGHPPPGHSVILPSNRRFIVATNESGTP